MMMMLMEHTRNIRWGKEREKTTQMLIHEMNVGDDAAADDDESNEMKTKKKEEKTAKEQ